MTRIAFVGLLLLTLGFTACKKKDVEAKEPNRFHYPFDGVASASKNGVAWNAKVTAGYLGDNPKNYTIRIATFDADGYISDYVALGPIPFDPALGDTLVAWVPGSTQDLDSPLLQAFYERFFTKDLTSGAWSLNLSDPHRISLVYDSISNEVSGTFDASFLIGADTTISDWAKPVSFTNGTFKATVQHYQDRGK